MEQARPGDSNAIQENTTIIIVTNEIGWVAVCRYTYWSEFTELKLDEPIYCQKAR
jgi:adenosyl cobinamide kinase/adenosyl cobinamide phosphate guanylyltransferase